MQRAIALLLWICLQILCLFSLATCDQQHDKCFDGVYWMDPTVAMPYAKAHCPQGYRLAALADTPAHLRAARLIYKCKGSGGVAWIGSTNGGATHGGEIAVVAPKAIGPDAGKDAVGGVVKAANGKLAPLCERIHQP